MEAELQQAAGRDFRAGIGSKLMHPHARFLFSSGRSEPNWYRGVHLRLARGVTTSASPSSRVRFLFRLPISCLLTHFLLMKMLCTALNTGGY